MTKELTIDREKGFDSIDSVVNKDYSISIYERQEGSVKGINICSRSEWNKIKKFVEESFEEFDGQSYEHWLREGK